MEHSGRQVTVRFENDRGEVLEVELTPEADRFLGVVYVDDVPYHVERIPVELINGKYCVDADPDYAPCADADGYCVLLAPYSR